MNIYSPASISSDGKMFFPPWPRITQTMFVYHCTNLRGLVDDVGTSLRCRQVSQVL